MRISDWSSDVCSSDLFVAGKLDEARQRGRQHQKLADQFAAPLRLQVEHKAEALVRHERKGMRRIDRLRRPPRKNLLVEMVLQPGRVLIAKIDRVQPLELSLAPFLPALRADFLLPGHSFAGLDADALQLLDGCQCDTGKTTG